MGMPANKRTEGVGGTDEARGVLWHGAVVSKVEHDDKQRVRNVRDMVADAER